MSDIATFGLLYDLNVRNVICVTLDIDTASEIDLALVIDEQGGYGNG